MSNFESPCPISDSRRASQWKFAILAVALMAGACTENAVIPETCDCVSGVNCTAAQKARCDAPKSCNCETKENCSEAQIAECDAQAPCDCKTETNCSGKEIDKCWADNPAVLIVTFSDNDTMLDEVGTAHTIGVALNKRPKKDVTAALSQTPDTQAVFVIAETPSAEASVKFTPQDWDTPKYVAIMGIADHVMDGDASVELNAHAVSDDAHFNNLSAKSAFKVTDNDKAELVLADGSTYLTSENGDTATLKLALSSKPKNDVTVNLQSSNSKEGIIQIPESKTLTFTPENWNTPQDIVVKGVNDDAQDGPVSYKITMISVSDDKNFDGKLFSAAMTNADNDKAGYKAAAMLEIKEGETIEIPVSLTTAPSADVKTTLTVSDATEAAIAQDLELIFTADNYSQDQIIAITGIKDNLIDGDQTITISLKSSTEDSDYQDISHEINVIVLDSDIAEIIQESVPSIQEGESGELCIKLSHQPSKDVIVKASDKHDEFSKLSPTEIKFTSDNYNQFQCMAVETANDGLVKGNTAAKIEVSADSLDANFKGISKELNASVIDINSYTINLNNNNHIPSILSEASSGKIYDFNVKLNAKPNENVIVSCTAHSRDNISSIRTEISIENKELTFNSENWNTCQTLKFHSIDDNITDGDQIKQYIQCSTKNTAGNFKGVSSRYGSFTIADDEQPGIIINSISSALDCNNSASFNVSLAAKPAASVTVTPKLSLPEGFTITPTSLSFNSTNYDTPKAFTVKFTNAPNADKNILNNVLTLTTACSSSIYHNITKTTSFKYYPQCKTRTCQGPQICYYNLLAGKYKLQAWGAGGSLAYTDTCVQSKGGYTSGIVNLSKKTKVRAVVGGVKSPSAVPPSDMASRTYLWGGSGVQTTGAFTGMGGGSSDIRFNEVADDKDWAYRLMVAGGGGGCGVTIDGWESKPGFGGSILSNTCQSGGYVCYGGDSRLTKLSQSMKGGEGGKFPATSTNAKGESVTASMPKITMSGAGGSGYFGGKVVVIGENNTQFGHGGGGGSSFIFKEGLPLDVYKAQGGLLTSKDYLTNTSFTPPANTLAAGANGKTVITVVE